MNNQEEIDLFEKFGYNISRPIDTRNSLKVVTSNGLITSSGLGNLSLKARKMFYIAIAQCRQNDEEFFEYEMSVKEFATLLGINSNNVYQEGDKITDELIGSAIAIYDYTGNYRKYSLFSRCDYEDNKFLFKLNNDLKPLLLALKGEFSQPLLSDFTKMKSTYSIAIWHLINSKMLYNKSHAYIYISLDEMRLVTRTENKFKQIGEFKKNVLDKAITEIFDNTGYSITYKDKKNGRTIIGFDMEIKSLTYIEPSQSKSV